jgi:hypothetical protein
MSQTILIKKSGTATNVPPSLAFGEIAINYADSKLFFKNLAGAIVALNDWATVFNKPTTLAGYGITDALQASNATLTSVAALSTSSTGLVKLTAGAASLDTSAYLTGNQSISYTGDATGSGSTSVALTLAASGVTAGTYGSSSAVAQVTVDAKGRVTSATAVNVTPAAIGAVSTTQLGAASGVATLDGTGKLTTAQIPSSLIGGLNYQGTWNATTNIPALVSSTGTKGYYYKVATAGATSLDGLSQWNVGDSVVFDGTTWDKIDGIANEVISVAGRSGTVVLTSTDVGLGNVTNVAQLASTQTLAVTGDATASATALSTGSIALTLSASGVTAGTYDNSATQHSSFTVDAKGRITSVGAPTTIAPAFSSITGTPTTLAGYGVTDAQALNAKLTSIAALSSVSTGLVKLTNGVASFDSSAYITGNQAITLGGDVTGTGTTAITGTIAAGAVTLAKMANMATASLIYRKTAGTGAPEVNTLATLKTDLGLTGTNSGDQTITLTGDATGTGTGSFAVTLAASGVTAGTYSNSATQHSSFTVDAKGRVTAAGSATTITPAFSSITGTPTTITGYGITDGLRNTDTIDGGSF